MARLTVAATPREMRKDGTGGSGRRGRRFTLIEMLIVVAIVAILAALLAPALRRALGAAMMTQCMNNLKQCNLVIQYYFGDYKEKFRYRNSWGYGIECGGYMDSGLKKALNCPTVTGPRKMHVHESGMYSYDHIYGYNNEYRYVGFNKNGKATTMNANREGWENGQKYKYLVLRDVKSPSKYVLLGDNRKKKATISGVTKEYPGYNENYKELSYSPISFVHRYGMGVTSFLDGSTRGATAETLLNCYSTNLLDCFFDPGEYR